MKARGLATARKGRRSYIDIALVEALPGEVGRKRGAETLGGPAGIRTPNQGIMSPLL
jgi:hypothetical protein